MKRAQKSKQLETVKHLQDLCKRIKKHWRKPSKKTLEIFNLQEGQDISYSKRKPSISLKNTQLIAENK